MAGRQVFILEAGVQFPVALALAVWLAEISFLRRTLMPRVPSVVGRKGTPSRIIPDGDYLLEVTECKTKETIDEVNDLVLGVNYQFRFAIEDTYQPNNEGWLGSSYFENVFIMYEDHPKYDAPLQNDPSGRTIGDMGPDTLVDIGNGMGLVFDDDEVPTEIFIGQRVVARIRQKVDKSTGEKVNVVRKWSGPAVNPEAEEAPATSGKKTAKSKAGK